MCMRHVHQNECQHPTCVWMQIQLLLQDLDRSIQHLPPLLGPFSIFLQVKKLSDFIVNGMILFACRIEGVNARFLQQESSVRI